MGRITNNSPWRRIMRRIPWMKKPVRPDWRGQRPTFRLEDIPGTRANDEELICFWSWIKDEHRFALDADLNLVNLFSRCPPRIAALIRLREIERENNLTSEEKIERKLREILRGGKE